MEWYALFRPHILDRGIEYYEDGNVVDFECTEDTITARITGSEDYNVEIDIEKEDVLGMYCSCPYARDGKNCKHMAAVLFRFEEMHSELDRQQVVDSFEQKTCSPIDSFCSEIVKKKQKIEELVAKIPENDIKELVELCDILHVYDNTEIPQRIIRKHKEDFSIYPNSYWNEEDILGLLE